MRKKHPPQDKILTTNNTTSYNLPADYVRIISILFRNLPQRAPMVDPQLQYPEESRRTQYFRRVIIRKTLQIARENPQLGYEEIADLAEKILARVCDLCVNSAMEETGTTLQSKIFLQDPHDERRDHVGRFFLFPLEKELRSAGLKDFLPAIAQSVPSLLGHEVYQDFSTRLQELLTDQSKQGKAYQVAMTSPAAQIIIREIHELYKKEILNSPGFGDRLKNQFDEVFIKAQKRTQQSTNMEKTIDHVYNTFIRILGLPGKNN